MSEIVMLSPEAHLDLKVDMSASKCPESRKMATPVFVNEIAKLQKVMPILLRYSEEEERYFPVALLGLEKEENLFLKGDAWEIEQKPLLLKRGPFLIGDRCQAGSNNGGDYVITVNLEDPRVSEDFGDRLFTPVGGNTSLLDEISDALFDIHKGAEPTVTIFNKLASLELICPISFDFDLKNGERYSLNGFYTIDRDKMNSLADDVLANLVRSGTMNIIDCMLMSLSNIQYLLDEKIKVMAGQ